MFLPPVVHKLKAHSHTVYDVVRRVVNRTTDIWVVLCDGDARVFNYLRTLSVVYFVAI